MWPAQNQMLAAFFQFVMQVFKGVETSGIHCENFAHAKNENLRFLTCPLEGGLELVGCSEEERAEDTEYEDPIRNLLADQRMMGAFRLGCLVHGGYLGGFGD